MASATRRSPRLSTPSSKLVSMWWHLMDTLRSRFWPADIGGPTGSTRESASRSTGRVCALWERNSTRWPSRGHNRPRSSLPMRAIVSAISTNSVKILRAFSGQTAHKVQLDALVVVPKCGPAAFKEILVLDLLADLLTHVVAGHFRCQRQTRATRVAQQFGNRRAAVRSLAGWAPKR